MRKSFKQWLSFSIFKSKVIIFGSLAGKDLKDLSFSICVKQTKINSTYTHTNTTNKQQRHKPTNLEIPNKRNCFLEVSTL